MATFDLPGTDQAVEIDEDTGRFGRFSLQWVNVFTKFRDSIVGRSQADITSNRPTSQLVIGLPFYDTTLGKPIWIHQVNPTVIWHDATGAVV